MVDLDDESFLVKFLNGGDYLRALLDGPWVIQGSYLLVQPWTPKLCMRYKRSYYCGCLDWISEDASPSISQVSVETISLSLRSSTKN